VAMGEGEMGDGGKERSQKKDVPFSSLTCYSIESGLLWDDHVTASHSHGTWLPRGAQFDSLTRLSPRGHIGSAKEYKIAVFLMSLFFNR
jgi:hypothetical protein